MIFGQPLKPSEAATQQGVTPGYLAKLRRVGLLKEAVHYRWLAPGKYRYLSEALDNFFAHRSEPEIHNKWVEKKLKELNKRQL
jgi:hypothetical protein